MDRKWILFGLIFILLGSVSAADLENHDFDGYFSMDVPKGTNFTNHTMNGVENGTDIVIAAYMADNLEITYLDAPHLFDDHAPDYFVMMFEMLYPGFELYHSGSEGNVTLFEAVDGDWTSYPVVGTADGNKMIFIIGDDFNLIKEMGSSIKFNEDY